MPLPPDLDKKIRKQFEELEQTAVGLVSRYDRANGFFVDPEEGGRYTTLFHKIKVQFNNLMLLVTSNKKPYAELLNSIQRLSEGSPYELKGLISGVKSDYESGMLQSIEEMIETNVVNDYFLQAEQLLAKGKTGPYSHVPAAVLAGAVLEDALRRLCLRQNPPIKVKKPKGDYKTLNPLIEELKAVNVYNELRAKQLGSWADIRNAAAHGRFSEFTRQDVEQMLNGIEVFLADYL